MYIDRTYIMYLAVPLACADRIHIGIQSVIYMKGKDISFCVSVWVPVDIGILCFYLNIYLDILISGCSRRNIVKQTDVSIL